MKYHIVRAPIEEGTSVSPAVNTDESNRIEGEEPIVGETSGGDQSPASATTEEKPEGQAQAGQTPAEAPAFTPSFKVKVMDQELEIPENFRGLIKDAKTQKEVQEIFEKAYGLEHHKKKTYEPLVQKYTTLESQVKNLDQGMTELHKLAQDPKTFGDFLDFWKIDKKILYQFVADDLRFEELPENEKNQILEQKRKEREAGQHRLESESYRERWLRSEAEKQLFVLDTAISRPDIAEVASQFDARAGKPGSFKQEVIYRGVLHEQTTGKVLPVEEAIRQVMGLIGYDEVDEAAAGQPASQKVVASVPQKKLPVIPAVGGGSGASPVKRAVNSTEDLRKIYQEKFGSKNT
jgi:hypothetical protein